jgi:hypothetical protein
MAVPEGSIMRSQRRQGLQVTFTQIDVPEGVVDVKRALPEFPLFFSRVLVRRIGLGAPSSSTGLVPVLEEGKSRPGR